MKIKIPQWLASFLKGAGSVLNISPAPPPRRSLTDEEAMASDWQKVGDDLREAMNDVRKAEEEIKNQKLP